LVFIDDVNPLHGSDIVLEGLGGRKETHNSSSSRMPLVDTPMWSSHLKQVNVKATVKFMSFSAHSVRQCRLDGKVVVWWVSITSDVIYPLQNQHSTWTWMVGILLCFWEGLQYFQVLSEFKGVYSVYLFWEYGTFGATLSTTIDYRSLMVVVYLYISPFVIHTWALHLEISSRLMQYMILIDNLMVVGLVFIGIDISLKLHLKKLVWQIARTYYPRLCCGAMLIPRGSKDV